MIGGSYVTVKRNLTERYFPHAASASTWQDTWGLSPKTDALHRFNLPPHPDFPTTPWFCPMPPPNITGQLHLGHALFLTLQDIQTRARALMGQETLWIPGTDHAGLATHAKIIDTLAQQGCDPYDAEAYDQIAENWKNHHHDRIITQMKAMGPACDWDKERFTLDASYQKTTWQAFKQLIEDDPSRLYRQEDQWYLNMEDLARPLIQALEKGHIQITPTSSKSSLLHMLRHIEPWCLSRQIRWGMPMPHRINPEGQWAFHEPETACLDGYESLPDTLDTWFLSSLWPLALLGWPQAQSSHEWDNFYPAAWIETGEDILFFWCARMLMMGYALTGQWPFKNIYLHGLIRDGQGRKMSKSLGNGIDPMEWIKRYGADTLRWTLACHTEPGLDMKISEDDLKTEARFLNKIYQSARFLDMHGIR